MYVHLAVEPKTPEDSETPSAAGSSSYYYYYLVQQQGVRDGCAVSPRPRQQRRRRQSESDSADCQCCGAAAERAFVMQFSLSYLELEVACEHAGTPPLELMDSQSRHLVSLVIRGRAWNPG